MDSVKDENSPNQVEDLADFFRKDSFHRLLTETAREVIVVHDLSGVIRYANGAAISITGVAEEEILGRNVMDLLTPEGRARAKDRREKRMGLDTSVFRYETEILSKNGTLPVEVSSSLMVRNGKPAGVLLIARDISERVSHDDEVKRLNEELENRVRARTHELEGANADLEAFASSLTHDLRTPLAAMEGLRESLFLDYGDRLDEGGKQLLVAIKEQTKRMTALIDAMLELARMSRATIEPRELDLADMARGIIVELEASSPERKVRVEIPDNIKAHGDPILLRSALRNLLANAWKFTKKSDDAVIIFKEGKCAHTPDGYKCYIVSDNGIGFDENESKNLFRAFSRLKGSENFEGFGIGLASAERIIARHDGTLGANGIPGKGATFWFCLPEVSK